MKKLKIGIVIDQLVSGGVQKTAIQEAKELIKLGHSVTLFVLVRLRYSYQYEDLSRKLSVVYVSDFNPPLFRQAFRLPFFSFLTHLHLLNPFFVSRYQIFKKFDVFIAHGTTTCITAAAISRAFKVPYVAFIWDPLTYILEKVYGTHPIVKHFLSLIRPIVQWYEKDFLLGAALVATASEVHQKYIKDKYQVNPLVIYPGIELSKKKISKKGRFILGYTRWQLAKNPRFFLRLAQKLPQLKFIIAGDWPDKSEENTFKNEIKALKLDKQISLISKVTRKDLPILARKSFVWLHPHFEAFGMSGLEMAALGLPLIIPEGSGITELFTDGCEGYFPQSLKVQEIVKRLEFLSTHPLQAQRMGENAAAAARKFTWQYHTQQLILPVAQYASQTKIVATCNAFVTPQATGGGDRFFIELARRIPHSVYLTIVLPWVGLPHFQKARINGENIRYVLLPATFLDNHEGTIPLVLAYYIRALQTVFILRQIPPFSTLHSATDLIPDTIPAYIHRLTHKNVAWVARFFHFYAHPWKRQGSFLKNTGSFLLQRMSFLFIRYADVVLLDNMLLKDEIAPFLRPNTKIAVSSGGVEIEKIAKAHPQTTFTSTALFIGRLSAHKGVFDAVDVWRLVCKRFPKSRLLFLGYAPENEMKKVQEKIRQFGLISQIKLVGFVHDRETVYRYLHSSKLLLFLDHEAGFGLVVAEAMAAGLPVIAYDLPIFGTVYHKGFITVPLKDTRGIAHEVIRLLSEKEIYLNQSREAIVQARDFDWETTSRRFYRVLTTYANKA